MVRFAFDIICISCSVEEEEKSKGSPQVYILGVHNIFLYLIKKGRSDVASLNSDIQLRI